MKTIVVICAVFCGVAMAQNDTQKQNNDAVESDVATSVEEKRRPSWSQGLPERRTAPTSPGMLSKPVADIENEPQQIEIQPQLEAPEINIEFQPKPSSEFKVEKVNLSREELRESYYEFQAEETKPEPIDEALLAQYKWQVVKVNEVEVPNSFDASQALNLNIHISPNGKVIDVVSEDNNLSSKDLSVIRKSIKKWRFEPPADLGIDINLSKSFSIDIQAD